MSRHAMYVGVGGVREPETVVEGAEGEHAAKVKRLRAGDGVELFDGAGVVGVGVVAEVRRSVVRVRVESVERFERVRPAVEVWGATPKGPRLEKMLDMLSQAGAASWCALHTKHGVVDPGEGKRERAERVVMESLKQCRRAWLMEIGEKSGMDAALEAGDGVDVVMADASGGAYERSGTGGVGGAERVRLLIGPEGGWHAQEVESARRAGARIVSLGPHAMRIETAAVVGVALILNAEGAGRYTGMT